MRSPFTLRQLEYFDAIATEGSLARAAQRCHVSASALALALDELEARLGLQLFIRRKGRGVELAPAGARLLSYARRLLVEADLFAGAATQNAEGLSGRLAIGCFPTLAPFFLPRVIDGFRDAHPQLELEFVEATAPQLHERLLQGRIEVALLYSVDVATDVSFEPLAQYRPYVLVAAHHPLADRGSIALAEIADEPLIQIDVRPSRQNTEMLFAGQGLRPAIRHTTTNYELARCLVGRGLGYAVLVQRLASQIIYDGHEVATLEISDDVPVNTVGLARPTGSPDTAKYRVLRSLLGHRDTTEPAPGPPIARH